MQQENSGYLKFANSRTVVGDVLTALYRGKGKEVAA
jgi:hypothetical protein